MSTVDCFHSQMWTCQRQLLKRIHTTRDPIILIANFVDQLLLVILASTVVLVIIQPKMNRDYFLATFLIFLAILSFTNKISINWKTAHETQISFLPNIVDT